MSKIENSATLPDRLLLVPKTKPYFRIIKFDLTMMLNIVFSPAARKSFYVFDVIINNSEINFT